MINMYWPWKPWFWFYNYLMSLYMPYYLLPYYPVFYYPYYMYPYMWYRPTPSDIIYMDMLMESLHRQQMMRMFWDTSNYISRLQMQMWNDKVREWEKEKYSMDIW